MSGLTTFRNPGYQSWFRSLFRTGLAYYNISHFQAGAVPAGDLFYDRCGAGNTWVLGFFDSTGRDFVAYVTKKEAEDTIAQLRGEGWNEVPPPV
jgi:hypothetical protein